MLFTLVTLLVAQVPDAPTEFAAKVSARGIYETRDQLPGSVGFIPNFGFLIQRHTGSNITVSADALFNLFSNPAFSLKDQGSALRIDWTPKTDGLFAGASAAFFPFTPARLRLGTIESTALTGSSLPAFLPSATPALALSARIGFAEPFAWLVYAPRLSEIIHELEPEIGLVAGSSLTLGHMFRMQLAYVSQEIGVIPDLASSGIEQRASLRGAHGSIAWNQHGQIGRHVDFGLESTNPRIWDVFFERDETNDPVALNIGLEGNYLTTRLEDPDHFGKTRDDPATSAALFARARLGTMRLHGILTTRSVSFIFLAVPGFPPFKQPPASTRTGDERSVTLAADWSIPAVRVRPGIAARLTSPGTLTGPVGFPGNNPTPLPLIERTIAFRGTNAFTILPVNDAARPWWEFSANAVWEPVDALGFVAAVTFEHDPNRTSLKDDGNGRYQPTYDPPDHFHLNLLGQARF